MAESKNIQSDLIPKIASGFCGGIARKGQICGAVSGGILAINIFSGRNKPDESIEPCFEAVNRLINLFEKKFKTIYCYDLIGCDLGTKAGQKYFKKNKIIEQCYKYTQEATALALSEINRILK